MHGHAVMGEQGVQERAENAPLWGPSVKDQRSGDRPVRKSRTQVHRMGLKLNDELMMMS